MKHRIDLAANCLHLMSFLSFIGVIHALINYASLASGPPGPPAGFLGVLVIPCIRAVLFGFAFHYCATYLKRGSSKAWTYSVALLAVSLLRVVTEVLMTSFHADISVGTLAPYVIGTALPCLGLWALLQKGSRDFSKTTRAACEETD